MNSFRFTFDWFVTGDDAPELRETMGMLGLTVDGVNLMANQDVRSKTVRDSALLPAYPLAMWLAFSWWRLNWEPLPARGVALPRDWRTADELGAANEGFVWPRIAFASDGEVMQIWAESMNDAHQFVRYLEGLADPASIVLKDFASGCQDLIAGDVE